MQTLRPATLGVLGAAIVAVSAAVLAADGATGRAAFGSGDCEAIHPGVLAQPVLALTALVLAAAGPLVAWRVDQRDPFGGFLFATAITGAGLASFAAHATATATAATWDGAGVAAVLALVATRAIGAPPWAHAAALGAIVVTGLTASRLVEGAGMVSAILAAGAVAATHRRSGRADGWGIGAAALVAVGLAVWALGRSGGPLCDPGSVWQPHGAWHLLAAASLAAGHRYLVSGDGHTPRPGLRST